MLVTFQILTPVIWLKQTISFPWVIIIVVEREDGFVIFGKHLNLYRNELFGELVLA